MPKFAANLSFLFQEHDFLDRFAAARLAGFQAVEYLFPYDLATPSEIAARLEDNGLAQVLFNLGQGDWEAGERGITALPGRQDDVRRAVDNALRYADALGCRQLHMMAGIVPDGTDVRACEDAYVGNLAYAADALGREGIRALIEPLNSTDMPGYLLTTAGHAQRVIEAVGSKNLFLQYDFYHRQIMEGSLATGFAQHTATSSPISRFPASPAATSRTSARSTTPTSSTCWITQGTTAGSAASTGPRAARWRGSAGSCPTGSVPR